MSDISKHQADGTQAAIEARSKRSDILEMLREGEVSITDLLDAASFDKSYKKITVNQALTALGFNPKIRKEIYTESGLNESDRIGSLVGETNLRRNVSFIEAVSKTRSRSENWPWKSVT